MTPLAAPGALPALVHCTVGKDRAVDVRRAAVVDEYAAGAAEIAPATDRLGDGDVRRRRGRLPAGGLDGPARGGPAIPAAVDVEFGGIRALLAATARTQACSRPSARLTTYGPFGAS